jgi:hypothetical protein
MKLLRYYSILLSLFITIGTAILGFKSGQILFFFIFFPVIIYFILMTFKIRRGRKLLMYYNFILITIMAVMGFVGTTSIPQLISAALFSPIAIYFWLLVLPKKNKKLPISGNMAIARVIDVKKGKATEGEIEKLEEGVLLNKKLGKGFDIDRRMFLKLIGSTGLMVFIFSIFSQKAEGAFLGSVPGPGTVALKDTTGAQVDPAIKTPTDGYKITETDDSDPNFSYYGFVDKSGKWFIMREGNGAYRYTKGDSNFASNWTNNKVNPTIPYNYFDIIFD